MASARTLSHIWPAQFCVHVLMNLEVHDSADYSESVDRSIIAISNGSIPSLTPYNLPFSQNGGFICPRDTRMAISAQRANPMSCSMVGFSVSADRMALFRVIGLSNPRWPNGRISAKGHAVHFRLRFYGRVFRASII